MINKTIGWKLYNQRVYNAFFVAAFMALSVSIERDETTQTVDIGSSITVTALLKQLKINPVEVLVIRNGEVCIPTDTLTEEDTVQILSVVSGG